MKKLLIFIVSSAFALSLAACGSQSPVSESTTAAAETEASEETTASEEGVLVAYFSWSGNTEQMAQMIAEETGADLFEIEPAAPYTDDYDELLDIAQQEQADNARPEIASQVETGTAMTSFLWVIRTGGAMRRWQFIHFWRATIGQERL